jgi:hypothetical protein
LLASLIDNEEDLAEIAKSRYMRANSCGDRSQIFNTKTTVGRTMTENTQPTGRFTTTVLQADPRQEVSKTTRISYDSRADSREWKSTEASLETTSQL